MSKIISTCSFIEVESDRPLKSAFIGYFLWFLLISTAVFNCFNGTFKKCLTPYISVAPECKTSSTNTTEVLEYSSVVIDNFTSVNNSFLLIKTSQRTILTSE